jgi:hypothetical protein
MRFPETAKSSVSLAFSLGLIASIVTVGWYYIILPYRKSPQRPVFTNDLKAVPAPKSPITAIKVQPILTANTDQTRHKTTYRKGSKQMPQ